MTADRKADNPWKQPAVSHYIMVCLAALGAILLVLIQRGYGAVSLLMVLAGVVGGATRFGPFLVLLALPMCLNTHSTERANLEITDAILCGAALTYVVAHYRLQSLVNLLFPREPRRRQPSRRRSGKGQIVEHRRPARLVTPQEIGRLLLVMAGAALLAQVGWRVLALEWRESIWKTSIWQAILLTWLVGLTWLVVAGLMDYARRRRMTAEEAALFLQDTLWTETRREQRRINRWLAWARVRHQRRKDKR